MHKFSQEIKIKSKLSKKLPNLFIFCSDCKVRRLKISKTAKISPIRCLQFPALLLAVEKFTDSCSRALRPSLRVISEMEAEFNCMIKHSRGGAWGALERFCGCQDRYSFE